MTERERFWSKVQTGAADECWLWTASCFWDGYGQFSRNRIMRRAHRVAWEFTNGAIPPGLLVCHRCDQPKCVNPSHLFLGTVQDNSDDMVRKNRQARQDVRGTKNPNAKLTEADVSAIRISTGTFRSIGAKFGVSGRMVSYIKTGQSWNTPREQT